MKVFKGNRLKYSLVQEVMLLLSALEGTTLPHFRISFLVKESTLQSDFGNCVAVQFTSVEVK